MHGRLLLAAATVLFALAVAPPAHAITLYATTGTQMTTIQSDNGVVGTLVNVTGLNGGETLQGIDARPSDGKIFGITTQSRVVQLDPPAGAILTWTAVPTTPSFGAVGSGPGFDFDPVTAKARVVDNNGQNIVFTPGAAAIDSGQSTFTGASLSAAAYSNNYAGATSSTFYAIDYVQAKLRGTSNPSSGVFDPAFSETLGENVLTAPINGFVHFDIAADERAFATILDDGNARLYEINLENGAVTPGIDLGQTFTGMTAIAAPVARLTSATFSGTEGGSAVVSVERLGPKDVDLSVNYDVGGGTAAIGDYTATSGTLDWAPGDTDNKTFSVPLTDDPTDEPNETLEIMLSNAATSMQNPAVIAERSDASITILDNDATPVVTPPTQTTPVVTTPPTLTIPPRPPAARTPTPPRLTFPTYRGKLRDVTTTRGLAVRVTSNEACKLTAELRIDRPLSKKLKIGQRIARTTTQLEARKAKTIRLKPVAGIRKKLRSRRSVKTTVLLSCVDRQGDANRPISRTATLRR